MDEDETGTPPVPHTPVKSRGETTFRRVTKVSKAAALTTKQAVWDSNELSIEAALNAVDQWEQIYTGLRSLLLLGVRNAANLYGAAKDNAGKLENGLLLPVRDWILLPAFSNAEKAVALSGQFLQSEQAKQLVQLGLHQIEQIPVIGETVLAPSLVVSARVLHRTYQILQYPIPSQEHVRSTVDWTLNTTKHILRVSGREIALYAQRADANITRTLSHTQWKVLGSGPYATLNETNKQIIVDHVCERYLSQPTIMNRYELAAHIKRHNRILWHDLQTILKSRGGEITEHDVWLETTPLYSTDEPAAALFYYLELINGKEPPASAPWTLFRKSEQEKLETTYQKVVQSQSGNCTTIPVASELAQWYEPDRHLDVMVDQRRHAVSFFFSCGCCKSQVLQKSSDACEHCREEVALEAVSLLSSSHTYVTMLRRPVLWRFYGYGDRVRRTCWFLDSRNGLQPFDEEASAILEDAYSVLIYLNLNEPEKKQQLLTVEVPGPDGTERLVQFSSTSMATAIQKGLGAAVAIFKRRVYRGIAKTEDETGLAVPLERMARPDVVKQLQDTTVDESDKINHVCLIVHGIGEMLRSIDLFGLSLPTLSNVCESMRNNHSEVQEAHFAQMYPNASAFTGRVEYLPVEWHESFALLTKRRTGGHKHSKRDLNVMIKDISLRTIPNLREFANDTLMDVLFFMSPEHHDKIIQVVTAEMNLVVEKFRATTGFEGPISVIGHSLGSVIGWDILSNQIPYSVQSTEGISEGLAPEYPQLKFDVQNFFLLGSPLPVFLMIRNQRRPLSEDFRLRGCSRVFNIFHPHDPVAYRLEPCLHPVNANFEPSIIKHWNGGLRVQYRTRRIWRKLVETTANTQRNVVEAFEQSMAAMGLLDAAVDSGTDDDSTSSTSSVSEIRGGTSVITGQLNQGRRIDYLLQEKEIENANEYVSALAAHSSYWIEKDLSLFFARQIYLSELERGVTNLEAVEIDAWETITPEDVKM